VLGHIIEDYWVFKD
jgi:hypothetical protein